MIIEYFGFLYYVAILIIFIYCNSNVVIELSQ